ncbi:hypothetical protein ACLOJK_031835 [Asimina triloba]
MGREAPKQIWARQQRIEYDAGMGKAADRSRSKRSTKVWEEDTGLGREDGCRDFDLDREDNACWEEGRKRSDGRWISGRGRCRPMEMKKNDGDKVTVGRRRTGSRGRGVKDGCRPSVGLQQTEKKEEEAGDPTMGGRRLDLIGLGRWDNGWLETMAGTGFRRCKRWLG